MEKSNVKENLSAFETSVSEFSAENIESKPEKGRKRLPGLLFESLIIALCIGVFGYAVMTIAIKVNDTRESESAYGELISENYDSQVKRASSMAEPQPIFTLQQTMDPGNTVNEYVDEVTGEDDIERRNRIYRSFINAKNQYSNLYAWIYVDNTRINYPVMKSDDNYYYLEHDFKGNKSASGSIYLSAELSGDIDANVNNLIYGHCMKNGTMFRTLKTFLEQANRNTLAKTMRIEIYTEKGIYIYRVLSAYRDEHFTFEKTIFADKAEYLSYLDTIAKMNTLKVTQPYNADSRICTLVTCANVSSKEDERYVMHGILTNIIPASDI